MSLNDYAQIIGCLILLGGAIYFIWYGISLLMDFTGWVPPEIKTGCGIIILLSIVLAVSIYFNLAR